MSALTSLPNEHLLSPCPQVLMTSSLVRCQGPAEKNPFLLHWKAWTSCPRSWIRCVLLSQWCMYQKRELTEITLHWWQIQERLRDREELSSFLSVLPCSSLPCLSQGRWETPGEIQVQASGGWQGSTRCCCWFVSGWSPTLPCRSPALSSGMHKPTCASRYTVVVTAAFVGELWCLAEDADSSAERKPEHLWNLCISLDVSEQVSSTPSHTLRGQSGAEGVTW